ncbi:amidohydrolase family protein [Burkholderia ambifaria]|uniref:amidohydrolase family protein n=1 Tax=Burkholderia ambifaria TaxID=152480 RepID=UPI002FE371B9
MDEATRGHAAHSCCAGHGIDVHTHVVPADFPRYAGAHAPSSWPLMAPAHACHRHVMIDGAVYRTVSDQCWDVGKRIDDMTAQQVGIQALSPMPELLSYWMPAADAAVLLRYINDEIGGMVAQSGGCMIGLGAVPLQDIDAAIAELSRLMAVPEFAGVEVGSNVNGVPIGDPRFDPFFEAAEALGAAIFVHALKPAGRERLVGPKPLLQALGYPTDVGLAAASVICTNLIVRRPRLRIAFSHGGGTLASLLPRLEQAHSVFAPLGEAIVESPSAQARRLYYDALVFDHATLAHLVSRFGETQIMLGTDYPFAFRDKDPVGRILSAGLEPSAQGRLIHQNAETFLGMRSRSFA